MRRRSPRLVRKMQRERPAQSNGNRRRRIRLLRSRTKSRACNSFAKNAPGLPKFSDGCIILTKGERVVITSWSNDPHALRKGYALYWPYYCVRPASMDTDRCYYTDLTALEVDGVRGATVGMYEEPPEKPITRDDCRTHADTFMLTRKMSMREASRYSKCVAMYGEPPQIPRTAAIPGELPPCDNEEVEKVFRDIVRPGALYELSNYNSDDDISKRWCHAFFASGPYREAVFTLEWQNKSQGRWWLEVRHNSPTCRGTNLSPNDDTRCGAQ